MKYVIEERKLNGKYSSHWMMTLQVGSGLTLRRFTLRVTFPDFRFASRLLTILTSGFHDFHALVNEIVLTR